MSDVGKVNEEMMAIVEFTNPFSFALEDVYIRMEGPGIMQPKSKYYRWAQNSSKGRVMVLSLSLHKCPDFNLDWVWSNIIVVTKWLSAVQENKC